jgi:hypothetical protein
MKWNTLTQKPNGDGLEKCEKAFFHFLFDSSQFVDLVTRFPFKEK